MNKELIDLLVEDLVYEESFELWLLVPELGRPPKKFHYPDKYMTTKPWDFVENLDYYR